MEKKLTQRENKQEQVHDKLGFFCFSFCWLSC
uniref:Uncharacterized protein n=1 Tax=Arundo donax TaxID=35708 RepID=A0A0A8XYM9_ARUDO